MKTEMGYYRCPACRAISTAAKKCEFCGAPKPKPKKKKVEIMVGYLSWLEGGHERHLLCPKSLVRFQPLP